MDHEYNCPGRTTDVGLPSEPEPAPNKSAAERVRAKILRMNESRARRRARHALGIALGALELYEGIPSRDGSWAADNAINYIADALGDKDTKASPLMDLLKAAKELLRKLDEYEADEELVPAEANDLRDAVARANEILGAKDGSP